MSIQNYDEPTFSEIMALAYQYALPFSCSERTSGNGRETAFINGCLEAPRGCSYSPEVGARMKGVKCEHWFLQKDQSVRVESVGRKVTH